MLGVQQMAHHPETSITPDTKSLPPEYASAHITHTIKPEAGASSQEREYEYFVN